jgi:hypothetical protein
MRRFLHVLALVLALAARAPPATAEEPRRTCALSWARSPRAEACIGPRDLALAVERRIGRAVFVSPALADRVIEGRIEPASSTSATDEPAFRAHITLIDTNGAVLGTRDLDGSGPTCRALDDQIALVVALLIDPDAMLAPLPPKAPPPVVVERVFVPVPMPAPSPPPSLAATKPWHESLSLGPLLAFGLLPGAGVAVALRAEIIPPSLFPFEIGGVVFLDARAAPAGAMSPDTKGAVLGLAYGMIGACPLAWSGGGFRVAGCAELAVGAFRAVGYGFATGSGASQEQPVVQATVAGRVTRRLVGPLEIGLGIGLVVPLRRVHVYATDASGNQEDLFRASAVAGVADGTLGLGFP